MRAEPDRQHATKVGDLVRTVRGRDVLRAHGVHLDLAGFVAALLPPAAMELGDGRPLVLSAQQPYLDYRRSVLAKVDLRLALGKQPDLATAFIWLDTDGASSDALMTSVAWPARPSGYLPLFYACASDGRRLRLWRAIEDREQAGLARCNACGIEYRFRLGRSARSMAELAAAGRWSPDLCWLLLLRERISGYVAGASSAVYGLVLQAVAKEVFGQPLPPVHVPEAIARDTASAAVDSLLHAACPPPPAAEEGARWRLAG
jgi:hypothetical protein